MGIPEQVQKFINSYIDDLYGISESRFQEPFVNLYNNLNHHSGRNEFSDKYNEDIQIATYLLICGYVKDNPQIIDGISKLWNITELPKVEHGDSVAANIFLIKMPRCGVPLAPDWLIYLIETCADNSPGYIQLIYKELLESINKLKFNNNGIPNDYIITAEDFANCFPDDFPIIEKSEIRSKYEKLWDAQKTNNKFSDNKCDTIEYWQEVIKI